MKSNEQLKVAAKKSLEGKWGEVLTFTLVFLLISLVISTFGTFSLLTASSEMFALGAFFTVIYILIAGPLAYGVATYFYQLASGKKVSLELLGAGFANFGKTFGLGYWVGLKILVWSCLLIVPGIIAALRYSLSWFVLIDNPKLGIDEATKKSSKIMEGHKLELCQFMLSFLGWFILGALTLGLAFVYILPYFMTSFANFYRALKKK